MQVIVALECSHGASFACISTVPGTHLSLLNRWMLYLIQTSHSNTDLSKMQSSFIHRFMVKIWCLGLKQWGRGWILLHVVVVTSPAALLPVKTISVQGVDCVDWLGLLEIKQIKFFPNNLGGVSCWKTAEWRLGPAPHSWTRLLAPAWMDLWETWLSWHFLPGNFFLNKVAYKKVNWPLDLRPP